MRKKSTSTPPKMASKPASDAIRASDISDATNCINRASIARGVLSQKQQSDALPPEDFWDKKTIKTMRERYGRNFNQADRILRELAKNSLEIETCRFIMEDFQDRIRRAMEREKELGQKIVALDVTYSKRGGNQHGKR